MMAICSEKDRTKVSDKMKELGVRGAFQRFRAMDDWYISINTSNLTLYYYCKSLLSKEEQEFFY